MFGFGGSKELKKENAILAEDKAGLTIKVANLREIRKDLTEQVEDLKLKKKISEEDIKHMVKMKMEKQELELKRQVMDITKDKDDAIAQVKDTYREKLEGNLKTQLGDMKDMYGDILKRLPNLSAHYESGISREKE